MTKAIVVSTVSVMFRSGDILVMFVSVLVPVIVRNMSLPNAVPLLSGNASTFVTFSSVLETVRVWNRLTSIETVEFVMYSNSGDVFALNQGWKTPIIVNKTPMAISTEISVSAFMFPFFIWLIPHISFYRLL